MAEGEIIGKDVRAAGSEFAEKAAILDSGRAAVVAYAS
jgi:hypothetical protein